VKLLNILTVMLLLTRTFAARAQSRQIRWRQIKWLKQQEDFSEQLRQHPDKALQQELEAQISRNPLARSDQQFIDNLASQQRESTGINQRKVLCISSPSQYRKKG
jgi:conjugal transfer pilus assembly protein TrbC